MLLWLPKLISCTLDCRRHLNKGVDSVDGTQVYTNCISSTTVVSHRPEESWSHLCTSQENEL